MRAAWNIAIIASLLFLPWWLTSAIVLAAFFFIRRFYEGIFYGIIMDAFYGTRQGIYGFEYIFSVASVAAFLAISVIREKVMW